METDELIKIERGLKQDLLTQTESLLFHHQKFLILHKEIEGMKLFNNDLIKSNKLQIKERAYYTLKEKIQVEINSIRASNTKIEEMLQKIESTFKKVPKLDKK